MYSDPITVVLSDKGWIRSARGHDIDPASLSYKAGDGFRLAGIRRDGMRSVFQFEDRTDRESVTLSFFNNEGSVRPLAYSAAIKDLKALIHNL